MSEFDSHYVTLSCSSSFMQTGSIDVGDIAIKPLDFISPLHKIPSKVFWLRWYPAGFYLLKVNNRNTRTRCDICSKLTIRIPEHVNAGWVCLN